MYVANTLGPSIKYVRCLRGRDVVKAKAYIYCFYEVILLFKSVQRGGVSENHQIWAYVLYGWSLLLCLTSWFLSFLSSLISSRFPHLTSPPSATRIPAKMIMSTYEKPMVLVSLSKNVIFYGQFEIFWKYLKEIVWAKNQHLSQLLILNCPFRFFTVSWRCISSIFITAKSYTIRVCVGFVKIHPC